MREIVDFLPRIMEVAPGCPEPTAIRHLRWAARKFLRRTRLWRESDSFAVDLADCQALCRRRHSTILEIPWAAFLAVDAEADAVPLDLVAITLADLDDQHPGWRDLEDTPEFFTQYALDTIRLVPKAEGTLKCELILIPSEDATALPDFMFDKYADEVCEGAKSRVLALPSDFANPQLALDARNLFDGYLDHFGSMASQGQQRARRRTRTAVMF